MTSTQFVLHEQLKKDLLPLGRMKVSQVFLLPDADNPWVVLVPELPNLVEWHDMPHDVQMQLTEEISQISKCLKTEFKADKVNVGALGNRVPQLHVHVMARYQTDRAWPGPIWGTPSRQDPETIRQWTKDLQHLLRLS